MNSRSITQHRWSLSRWVGDHYREPKTFGQTHESNAMKSERKMTERRRGGGLLQTNHVVSTSHLHTIPQNRGFHSHKHPQVQKSHGHDCSQTPITRWILVFRCKYIHVGCWVVDRFLCKGMFMAVHLEILGNSILHFIQSLKQVLSSRPLRWPFQDFPLN